MDSTRSAYWMVVGMVSKRYEKACRIVPVGYKPA
jgi:hypothetical protein